MTAEAPRPTPQLPEPLRRVHIIGICGTAMAALAGMLQERGITVTGSDAMAYPPVSDLLAGLEIPILLGYDAAHLDDPPDLVVVGNVSRRDNPEATRAREAGIPYMSLPEVLRLVFMRDKRRIVVTGTHGKTTTASIVAWLLHEAGLAPSYLIGGVPANFGSNYRLDRGDCFLIEGDEYDTAYFDKVPKLWHYPADFATINNIEFDHADIYGSVEEIEWVFGRFAAEQVSAEGALWVNGQDPRALRAAGKARARVSTFGLDTGDDAHPVAIERDPIGVRFELVLRGRSLGALQSPLWGEHNLRNTVGALVLCLEAGASFAGLQAALPGFLGVAKRQQVIGEVDGIVVIDDFAHHPTAVRETLRAIRGRFPQRRIWAVFEVKSNTSRRAVFQSAYPPAFDPADCVIFSDVWKQDNLPPEERISIETLVDAIRERGKSTRRIGKVDDIVEVLAAEVEPGDVVVGLSGSDFGGLHRKVLDRLSSRG